ncbi:flavin reductase family protein [Gordonia insulae]|uniref:NADH-dependent flavin reductase n=1 Tax=Gordonia insulae TaxID=2420509 RepID=A0A3G8JMC3_9ACTN|nr:flavin reductase family protein [Gordonia insulae]AZG45599.1 NADH-dependent flavin reductase [Gordonia insulae]
MSLDSALPVADDLAPATDSAVLKRAYSCFPSGVVAVACRIDGPDGTSALVGMAASAFTTVSLDPPLVSLCVQNTSTTWPRLRSAPAIGVSVFSRDQSDLCRQLAGPSDARFTGITPSGTDDGSVFIPDAAAALSCSLHNEIPAGDHTLVLLRIEALRCDPGVEPLVFHASTFRSLEALRERS